MNKYVFARWERTDNPRHPFYDFYVETYACSKSSERFKAGRRFMRKYVLYLRVSSAEQGKSTLGLEAQERDVALLENCRNSVRRCGAFCGGSFRRNERPCWRCHRSGKQRRQFSSFPNWIGCPVVSPSSRWWRTGAGLQSRPDATRRWRVGGVRNAGVERARAPPCPLESLRADNPFLWIGHGGGRRVNDNRTKILSTGVCGDVIHVSHFSSHASVEIKTSVRTGREVELLKSSSRKRGRLSVLRCGIKGVFQQRCMTVFHKVNRSGKSKVLSKEARLNPAPPAEIPLDCQRSLLFCWACHRGAEHPCAQPVPNRGMVVLERKTTKTKTTREVYLPEELMNRLLMRVRPRTYNPLTSSSSISHQPRLLNPPSPIGRFSPSTKNCAVCDWNGLSGVSSLLLQEDTTDGVVSRRHGRSGKSAHLWAEVPSVAPGIPGCGWERGGGQFRQRTGVASWPPGHKNAVWNLFLTRPWMASASYARSESGPQGTPSFRHAYCFCSRP